MYLHNSEPCDFPAWHHVINICRCFPEAPLPHWTVAVGMREDEKEEEKGPLKKRPERNPLSLSFFRSVSICETEKKGKGDLALP